MSVNEQIPVNTFVANDNIEFLISFYVVDKAELYITKNEVVVPQWEYELVDITDTADYKVVFEFPVTGNIRISRKTRVERSTDYDQLLNPIKASTLNNELDEVYRILQELGATDLYLLDLIEKEKLARIQGDLVLQNQLNIEIQNRIQGDVDLREYIDSLVFEAGSGGGRLRVLDWEQEIIEGGSVIAEPLATITSTLAVDGDITVATVNEPLNVLGSNLLYGMTFNTSKPSTSQTLNILMPELSLIVEGVDDQMYGLIMVHGRDVDMVDTVNNSLSGINDGQTSAMFFGIQELPNVGLTVVVPEQAFNSGTLPLANSVIPLVINTDGSINVTEFLNGEDIFISGIPLDEFAISFAIIKGSSVEAFPTLKVNLETSTLTASSTVVNPVFSKLDTFYRPTSDLTYNGKDYKENDYVMFYTRDGNEDSIIVRLPTLDEEAVNALIVEGISNSVQADGAIDIAIGNRINLSILEGGVVDTAIENQINFDVQPGQTIDVAINNKVNPIYNGSKIAERIATAFVIDEYIGASGGSFWRGEGLYFMNKPYFWSVGTYGTIPQGTFFIARTPGFGIYDIEIVNLVGGDTVTVIFNDRILRYSYVSVLSRWLPTDEAININLYSEFVVPGFTNTWIAPSAYEFIWDIPMVFQANNGLDTLFVGGLAKQEIFIYGNATGVIDIGNITQVINQTTTSFGVMVTGDIVSAFASTDNTRVMFGVTAGEIFKLTVTPNVSNVTQNMPSASFVCFDFKKLNTLVML